MVEIHRQPLCRRRNQELARCNHLFPKIPYIVTRNHINQTSPHRVALALRSKVQFPLVVEYLEEHFGQGGVEVPVLDGVIRLLLLLGTLPVFLEILRRKRNGELGRIPLVSKTIKIQSMC